jgi:hypothetical protein
LASVRSLGWILVFGVLLGACAASAEPPAREARSLRSLAAAEADRIRFGITTPWKTFGSRLNFGVGWSLPQRWYDTDGQLLTERSLLHPGDDLERSGLYFAVRF